MRCFYNGQEITMDQGQELEDKGLAKVIMGSSGIVPDRLGGPKFEGEPMGWIEMKDSES